MSEKSKTFATLVRGNIYVLGEKYFEAGVPLEVTAKEKAQLETDGVDLITVEGETLERPKFTFTKQAVEAEAKTEAKDVEGGEVSGGAAPRSRSR